MKRQLLIAALSLGSLSLSAQPWDIAGNSGLNLNNNYVGNNDNVHLNFRTDSLFRMRLWNTNNATLNTFNVPRNGFLGVSQQPLFFTNGPGAFSRLHLVDSVDTNPTTYAQDFGYRPWMRNGVTMTGNGDQMYIGQKYTYVDSMDYGSGEVIDASDAVIEWSDNPDDTQYETDRLRFMFTNDYQVAGPEPFGARSLEGMEAMRIYIPTDTTAHVGIGDFFRAGVINGQNEDPTERLHVRDGRVRIQELPDNAPADSDYVVMVVDTTANPSGERGVVKWVPASAILSAADCEWDMNSTSPNHVYTAVGLADPNCPDNAEAVGVGTMTPGAKLDVVNGNFPTALAVLNNYVNGSNFGGVLSVTGGTTSNQALIAGAFGPSVNNSGAVITTNGGTNSNTGLTATVSGTSTTNMGGRFTVSGGSASNTGLDAAVSSAGVANIGLNARVSAGSGTNTGASLRISGSAPIHHGASINVIGSTDINEGINMAVSSSGAGVDNAGVHMSCSTPTGSAHNRGAYVHLLGQTARSR